MSNDGESKYCVTFLRRDKVVGCGRAILAAALLSLLGLAAGCTPHIFEPFNVDQGQSVSLDAQQRVILVKRGVGQYNQNLLVCAEPSPDAISASAAALSAQASVPLSAGSVTASAAGSFNDAMASIGLRTATIQLLRDGLFNACEAYMNGVLTLNDYQTVVHNYDRVMVALLAIDAAAGSPHPAPSTVSPTPSPGSNANNGQQPGNSNGTGAQSQQISTASQNQKSANSTGSPSNSQASPGGGTPAASASTGITNADHVMEVIADYMLDNNKWLAATCITAYLDLAHMSVQAAARNTASNGSAGGAGADDTITPAAASPVANATVPNTIQVDYQTYNLAKPDIDKFCAGSPNTPIKFAPARAFVEDVTSKTTQTPGNPSIKPPAKSDPAIKQLQEALQKQNYSITPDGIWGPATMKALNGWATKNGQPQSNSTAPNPQTVADLEKAPPLAAEATPSAPAVPAAPQGDQQTPARQAPAVQSPGGQPAGGQHAGPQRG